MKRTFIKLSLYVIPIVLILGFLGSYADGNTDDNYRHFTSKASNIIMGDSRSAQAIVPHVLDEKLMDRNFDNFSLNITYSPYGEIYLNALKRKLKENTQKGIFILTVNPWNLSKTEAEKELKDFSEYNSPLNNVYFYGSPNYEYLLKHFPKSWYQIYRDREEMGRSSTYLHKNGWMEVSVNVEKDTVARRTEKKAEEYKVYAQSYKHSPYRLRYLEETIHFLKNHGTVYLVRIPASDKIMAIENAYWTQFNEVVENIAKNKQVKYFDFSPHNKEYIYTDGNHMYKESGKIFTAQIADSIKRYRLD